LKVNAPVSGNLGGSQSLVLGELWLPTATKIDEGGAQLKVDMFFLAMTLGSQESGI
jgi:hypothetical protein